MAYPNNSKGSENNNEYNYVIPVATPYSNDVEMKEDPWIKKINGTRSKSVKRVMCYHGQIEPQKKMTKMTSSKFHSYLHFFSNNIHV